MQLANVLFSGLGLAAPASSAFTGTDTLWESTQTQKYHCEGKDVFRCDTIAGGICIAMDSCKAYCFLHDDGVTCVDMGEPPVEPAVPVSASEAKLAGRDASLQKDEHYECSNDRTGVLICRWGFCSTDHYCKTGEECKDGFFSCAPKTPSVRNLKSESRDVYTQV